MQYPKTHPNRQQIHASIIGNVLEWYEFSLFAYLAPVIAELFFPSKNHILSLISTLFVFAAGFIVRPLGALCLGYLGDRWGRAKTLKLTIFLMSIASVLTGLLPTYAELGLLSPMLLMTARLIQGFCIGGEFAGSMIYLSESAHENKRALISSMTNNGSNIGVLLAIASCALLTHFGGREFIATAGWRILFLTGGFLGLLGLWMRRDLPESRLFLELRSRMTTAYSPIRHVLKFHKKKMLDVFGLLTISACGSYTLMGYISTYLHEFLQVNLEKAYEIQTGFILISLLLVSPFAYWSDRVGRKSVLIFSILGYLVTVVPSFWILQDHPNWWVLLPLVIFYSAEQAVTPAAIVELFPGKGRYTGISFAYNAVMALVGGFSAAINTTMISYFNNPMMIVVYIVIAAFVSLYFVIKRLPEDYGVNADLLAL